MHKLRVLRNVVLPVCLLVSVSGAYPLFAQSSDQSEPQTTEKKTPHDKINEYIAHANIPKIETLVTEHPSLLQQTGDRGWTPLHTAAGFGRHVVMPALLSHTDHPDVRSDRGATPLRTAALKPLPKEKRERIDSNFRSTVEWLLIYGADVSIRDPTGLTPLHVAVREEHEEIVAVLLNYGADPNTPSGDGRSAIDYAKNNGNERIVRLLKRHNDLYNKRNRVGVLADFDHVSISGNETFPKSSITSALRANQRVISASHPLQPLDEYTTTLKKKLREGYRYSGFPDVSVELELNESRDHMDLSVVEGPRFTAGELHIKETGGLDRERLRERITNARLVPVSEEEAEDEIVDGQPYDRKEPIWKEGAPVHFGAAGRKKVASGIEEEIRRLGYAHPDVDVDLERNDDGGTADLFVHVKNTGDPYRIGTIEVDGLRDHSKQEVLTYLDLEPGMTYDPDLERRIRRELRHSGRFLQTDVSLPSPDELNEASGDHRINMRISLIELPGIPSLDEQLPKRHRRLINAFDRLQHPDRHDTDLVVSLNNVSIYMDESRINPSDLSAKMVLDKSGHVLMSVETTASKPSESKQYVLYQSKKTGFYAPHLDKKLVGRPISSSIIAMLNIQPDPPVEWKQSDGKRDMSDVLFYTRFGSGFRFDTDGTPFDVDLQFPPVFASYIAEYGEVSESADGTQRIYDVKDSFRVTVNANTSRVSSLEFLRAPDQESSPVPVMTISTEVNALKEAVSKWKKKAEDVENVYDPRKPVTSIADVLLTVLSEFWAREDGLFARHKPLIRTFIDLGLLSPMDAVLRTDQETTDSGEQFMVPGTDGTRTMKSATPNAAMKQLLGYVSGRVGNLFDTDTVPWIVSREASRVLDGNKKLTGKVLEWLHENERLGPVGFYSIAYLMRHMGQTEMCKVYLNQAITHLAWTDVRRGVRLLFDRDSRIGQLTKQFIDRLRALNDSQVSTLLDLLPSEHRPHVKRLITTARTAEQHPYRLRTYDQAFRWYWYGVLQKRLGRTIENLMKKMK